MPIYLLPVPVQYNISLIASYCNQIKFLYTLQLMNIRKFHILRTTPDGKDTEPMRNETTVLKKTSGYPFQLGCYLAIINIEKRRSVKDKEKTSKQFTLIRDQ